MKGKLQLEHGVITEVNNANIVCEQTNIINCTQVRVVEHQIGVIQFIETFRCIKKTYFTKCLMTQNKELSIVSVFSLILTKKRRKNCQVNKI